ncbi:5-methylcytosine-specific restriction endonuclease system specificity protein McrC [Actinomyces vulturis]|uniref:5-methylcytosine-specific restriction endonuclease system specificity protein McrC n=1 Tax=Actinomyces vulturis TaxID=1857645 RepID=UPI0008311977|nr:5-methylcytosine-specific restriction endonuclease system specificity protein McrC [Actinomyces vulturis]
MILLQNVYYMLSYAFSVLREDGYKSIATEEFEHIDELYAAILERGITSQIKQGLGRDYVEHHEKLSSLRGKIDISDSLKSQSLLRHRLVCSFDEFSVDTPMNRIVKSTVELLLRSGISKKRKKTLRKLLMYFSEVQTVDLRRVNWRVRYDRNNQTYRMLIAICYMASKRLLQSRREGSFRAMDFFQTDEDMPRLYEKFILEYFRQEHPELKAHAPMVEWTLDDGFSDMLPTMRTDITLEAEDTVLIIDAKYYTNNTQQRFDSHTIHSGNLYQVFTYVKNKQVKVGSETKVSGMLLYAKTDSDIQPDATYSMSGNSIAVRTLDLNQPFPEIRAQLDGIADLYFPMSSALPPLPMSQ